MSPDVLFLYSGDSVRSFIILTSIVSLIALVCRHLLARPQAKLCIPRVGKDPNIFGMATSKADFLVNGHRYIAEGYAQFKDSMYLIQTADMERVVLSNKFVEELRVAPESLLSTREAMCERHLGQYTSLDVVRLSHLQNDVCRVQLTQNLSRLMPVMLEEAVYGLNQELADCSSQGEWQSHVGHSVILNIVSRVISRVFVGVPLCRNPEWLDTATGYTIDAFTVAGALRDRHWLARPLIYMFLDARKKLQHRFDTANRCLVPILKTRSPAKREEEKPEDLLQWMTDHAEGPDCQPERLVHKILFLCLASIHTSTMSACHVLFDLCQHPEYVKALRQEIEQAILEEGGLKFSAINKMRKLDSFLKESQRVNHPGSLSFNRKVLQPLTLSDGTVLPPGTFVCMPTAAIAQDPKYYTSPHDFQPWRFYDLRNTGPDDSNRHQFTSTSMNSLAFGHGKFSCPGRFFAAGQIKLILCVLIMKYDFCWPKGQKERPRNIYIDERIGPDRQQVVRFRSRKDVDAEYLESFFKEFVVNRTII